MNPLEIVNDSDSFLSFQKLLDDCKDISKETEQKNKDIKRFIKLNKENYPFRNGDEVYFIYHGSAKLVNVVGDFNGWDSFDETSVMINVHETDLFYLKKNFPPDSRLDYRLVVDTEWILDPLNNRKLLGGFGLNSELIMPNYENIEINTLTISKKGNVKEIAFNSKIQKNWNRKIFIYLPSEYELNPNQRYPSFYAIDATDYLTAGDAIQLLDENIEK